MRLNSCIILLAATILCISCTKPVKEYSYLNLNRLKGWHENIPLSLSIDMVDTTNACELYLVGEIATKRSIAPETEYPIKITLVAPDSIRYTDTVSLPLNVSSDTRISRKSHGVKEIVWPYRKNIYNKKPGRWEIIISQGDNGTDYSNIIGLGIHCKQNKL